MNVLNDTNKRIALFNLIKKKKKKTLNKITIYFSFGSGK